MNERFRGLAFSAIEQFIALKSIASRRAVDSGLVKKKLSGSGNHAEERRGPCEGALSRRERVNPSGPLRGLWKREALTIEQFDSGGF